MIDILYNKLGALNNGSFAEWHDVDPIIFNKHSQASHNSHNSHNSHKHINEDNTNIQQKTQEIMLVCEEKADTSTQHMVYKQQPIIETNIISKNIKRVSKDTSIKPLEIITKETTSFNKSTEYIKDALITLISKDEFTKIFGLTKCAEIMSGIVNNRWNKSTALFISFLLDKEVYYNEKIILYNKEKNTGRITM
jgi:hypothetical protein